MTKLHDAAMAAFLQALAAGVEGGADADRLAEVAAVAAVGAMREAWRMRVDAATTLLEAAEAALDRAEVTDDPEERRRELAMFELMMSAATV